MSSLIAWTVACATAVTLFTHVAQGALPQPAGSARVLIVTGIDYPGHHWRETAPALKTLLQVDPHFKVTITEDPGSLESLEPQDWELVLLHFMNWERPAPGTKAQTHLRRFVESGKGLMLVHFACGAWQDWPEFKTMAGRVWDPKLRPHDPHGPFTVEIVQPAHESVMGLTAFETKDELYTCLTGDVRIQVVAAARSKVDGKSYPMAFVLRYGRGRVFHTVLGHDVQALTNSVVPQLLRQGCAWASGLAVEPEHP
jgi:type 1 glutamine amidotransferase